MTPRSAGAAVRFATALGGIPVVRHADGRILCRRFPREASAERRILALMR